MYIKELEVDNFKSFANNITIPFLKGFTTISGPNGSGKSNIIDSILFALGLSTSRTLRAEKLFHLISTHTKRNEAFVKVTFGTDNDQESQIVVGRRIKKSSQGFNSVYYLNDKVSTLSEIHAELEKYNISPNSYNVMMQGDVTSITNCSANERRKIIDEIAGVADFDRRIEQATNELGTVEQRVDKSLLILSEVDTRIEQLSEEREQALKYQKLKDEKMQLESQITAVKYFDIQKSLKLTHQSILDFDKKKNEQGVNLKEIEKSLGLTKEKCDKISEMIKTKGEAEQLEVKKQSEELKGQIERKKSAINFAEKNIQDNLKTIEHAKNGIESLTQKIEDTTLKIEQKKDDIKIIETNITSEKSELTKVLQEMSGLNQSADEHFEKRSLLRKQLEQTKDIELSIEKQKAPLEAQLGQLNRQLIESKAAIEELENFKGNFSQNNDKLEAQVRQLSQDVEDYKLVQQNTMFELDKTKNEITDLAYNIRVAGNKIAQLEGQKLAFDEANFGRAIDTVINANLKGVHAPLVQLGSVDKQYALSVEIAMGSRIKNIVVDDDYVAKQAIEILKSANAGRATFLPLNKINKAPNSLKLPKEKGVVDFAINLVDFDEVYVNAFYHCLGETLVMEDYVSAQKLIGKYRMVTLAGEIFEKSGSISGGSVSRTGLKFSQNQDDELESAKSRLKIAEKKLADLENKRIQLETKQDKVRADYSSSMNELAQAKMELANLQRNNENTQKSIQDKKDFIVQIEPEITKIVKQLDDFEAKQVEINAKILELEEEIKQVESQMSEQELAKLKEMTESLEFQIKKFETQIANITNDINDLNREIDFSREVIKTKFEQIDKLQKDNEILSVDKKKYADEIMVLELQVVDLDKKIEELGAQFQELQKERDVFNIELLELSKQKNNIESNLERLDEQIESFKARRRELEPQLDEVRQELVNAGIELTKLEPVSISTDEITSKIVRLQKRMEDLEPVNMRAITAYDEVLARQQELKARIETLVSERKQILERMKGYEQLKKETFLQTYENINMNFKDIFAKLSDGEGTLILENPENPFVGGLTIEAQPRDKKKQRLESMSGGEKSLTALAFVFAIQAYMPAPFYAFDEVDMHLDGLNVEKLAEMIKAQSKNTQFIVVSLRKPMIESANRTIGVTQKEKGITRVTGVKLRD